MNFNNRISYLSWSSEWKSSYRVASIALRHLRLEFKQAQRDNARSTENKLRGQINAARQKAVEMLSERHDSKVEAQRQFLAERQVRSAA